MKSTKSYLFFFSRKLQGMFFIMLAALALFDSLYILLSLWEAMRREMNSNDFFAYAVRYVTYPLQNIVLCITIFLPVALAFERYRAIRYVTHITFLEKVLGMYYLKHKNIKEYFPCCHTYLSLCNCKKP